MEEHYSYWQRNELKQELIHKRIDMASGGFGFTPRCAICNKELKSGCDMHEALITRGDIRGQEHLFEYIMVEENCVLVCPGGSGSKCHRTADTKEGQEIVIRHLLIFVPDAAILAFLSKMSSVMKGTQAEQAIYLVKPIINEVRNGKNKSEMSSL